MQPFSINCSISPLGACCLLLTLLLLFSCRKLRREVFEKELSAFSERTAGGAFKPIERRKLEQNIKEFVRLSIRRMHAARSDPGGMQPGLGPGGMLLPAGMREPISGQLM